MTSVYILLALIAGAALPVQVGINHTLRAGVGSPVLAAFISFIVGSVCLLAYAMLTRAPLPAVQALSRLPAWAWLGGALGAYYVTASIFLAPRLGAANLVGILVAAQLIMSLVMDHYGLIGFARHAINLWRILGALLLIAGTVLISQN